MPKYFAASISDVHDSEASGKFPNFNGGKDDATSCYTQA